MPDSKKQIKLLETGFSLGKVTGKNRWRARLIKAGAGATGFYTEQALRETGAAAFPIGTKTNADHHQNWREVEEQPAGSITTLAGALVTDPVFEVEEGEAGLFAEIEFSDQWAPFVEQFAPILGLSINANGWGSEYTDTGLPIIEGIIPSPLNTVDLVTVAGAGGKLLQLVESYRENSAKMEHEDSDDPDRKVDGMKPEEIQALTEAITLAVKEALTPAPKEEEATKLSVSEVTEAVVKAELPEIARGHVYKAIESGTPVAEAIEEQKKFVSALTEQLKAESASAGKVVIDGTNKDDFIVRGW